MASEISKDEANKVYVKYIQETNGHIISDRDKSTLLRLIAEALDTAWENGMSDNELAKKVSNLLSDKDRK